MSCCNVRNPRYMPLPLISCLCVTRKKPKLLLRAINCFTAQTYRRKELVIIYEDNDDETHMFLEGVHRVGIRVICVKSNPKLTLGELRNIGLQHSKGEFFCQWDDDDWYHVDRLTTQIQYIQKFKKSASVLVSWLMYDNHCGNAYLSFAGAWAGSLMCKRVIGNTTISYPDMAKSEDVSLLLLLYSMNCIYPITMPYLYIYVYHGSNTWNKSHFKKLFSKSQKLSLETSFILRKSSTRIILKLNRLGY